MLVGIDDAGGGEESSRRRGGAAPSGAARRFRPGMPAPLRAASLRSTLYSRVMLQRPEICSLLASPVLLVRSL